MFAVLNFFADDSHFLALFQILFKIDLRMTMGVTASLVLMVWISKSQIMDDNSIQASSREVV